LSSRELPVRVDREASRVQRVGRVTLALADLGASRDLGVRPDREDTHSPVCQVYPVREVRRDLLADAGYLVLPVM
jgi:hypothetical protein